VVPPYFPVNLSFIYPIATNATRPDLWTSFDLALGLGRVGFVDGAQIGAIGLTTYNLRGVQIALASGVEGKTSGAQIGAVFAFANRLHGVHVSGLFGWANGELTGVQIAGLVNQTYDDIEGLQAAGFLNVARKQLTGVQVGGTNIGRVEGLQIGVVNVSQEVNGVQIGIVNVARKIHGLQVGIVNVTDNFKGESLGVVPLPRLGGVHLVAWGSNNIAGNLGLKLSSRYAYSILSGAIQARLFGAGLTLGMRFPLVGDFSLAADLGGYRFFGGGLDLSGHKEILKARILLSYQIFPRFIAPFVGAGAFVRLGGKAPMPVDAGPELSIGLEI
jgi:hypothetical protein